MTTNQDLQVKARLLMSIGGQSQHDQRPAGVGPAAGAGTPVLLKLPLNLSTPSRELHLVAANPNGTLVFQLWEREVDPAVPVSNEPSAEGTMIASSASAYDVLRTGFALVDRERFGASLEYHVRQSKDSVDPANNESVAEVEEILETNLLPPADRLRTKAEISEFLRWIESERVDRAVYRTPPPAREPPRAAGNLNQEW
jgi:hypothetical protein